MHKVKSTYKILANRVLQQDNSEDWIDWALEMMEAGYESEHLYILAGLPRLLNSFEVDHIVNRTLRELSLDITEKESIVRDYIWYLISEALDSKISTKTALAGLRDLCQKRNYDEELIPFYLLAFAQEELEEEGVQFHWPGASNDNLDVIIRNRFKEWKANYEMMTGKSA